MTKNILSLNDFKDKKSIQEEVVQEVQSVEEAPITEMVDAIDDFYRVSVDVDLPKSLVSSFIKKVKESTGKDLRADMGEKRLAERLVQWANENYLNIENLPTEIVTGADKGPVQAQAQTQVQPLQDEFAQEPQAQDAQAQDAQVQDVQAQSQVQAQPTQNVQAQKPAVQVQGQGQAQTAAAQIGAQEI